MPINLSLAQLVQTANDCAASGYPIGQESFTESDWKIYRSLASIGKRLPQLGDRWENIILAEQPFGPDQAAIDAKAEALSPQGSNKFRITGYSLTDDVVYIGFFEIGKSEDDTWMEISWMEIGQFAREFRRIINETPQQ